MTGLQINFCRPFLLASLHNLNTTLKTPSLFNTLQKPLDKSCGSTDYLLYNQLVVLPYSQSGGIANIILLGGIFCSTLLNTIIKSKVAQFTTINARIFSTGKK